MLALMVVALALGSVTYLVLRPATATRPAVMVPAASAETLRLAEYAERLYAEKKWLSAEKAFLNVLRVDHRNASAYSHLGIIYATQKNKTDALECFQLAAKIEPSAATFQNVGLGYYENRNYVKAAAAFEKAIVFAPSVGRYIGLSKARRALSDTEGVIAALTEAVKIDPSLRVLQLLEQANLEAGKSAAAVAIHEQITRLEHDHGTTDAKAPVKATA